MTLAELLKNGGKELITRALKEMPYCEYLRTKHWLDVRYACMKAAKWLCRLCGKRATDAHHLTYERRGEELPEDTVALCRPCHDLWHETWVLRCRAEGEQQFGAGANQ